MRATFAETFAGCFAEKSYNLSYNWVYIVGISNPYTPRRPITNQP